MTRSGSKTSATDPLHPNSFEIKGCSGVAAGTLFYVEKRKDDPAPLDAAKK
jgi:hypothetical protein